MERLNGENFGSYIMRKPKISNLQLDVGETNRVRKMAKEAKAIKITINIESSTLAKLKSEAARSGVPYQRLLNQALKQALGEKNPSDARLEKLEKEVAQIRRKLAA